MPSPLSRWIQYWPDAVVLVREDTTLSDPGAGSVNKTFGAGESRSLEIALQLLLPGVRTGVSTGTRPSRGSSSRSRMGSSQSGWLRSSLR